MEYVDLKNLDQEGKYKDQNKDQGFGHIVLNSNGTEMSQTEVQKYTIKTHNDVSCYYENKCKSEIVSFQDAASTVSAEKQAF